MRIRFVRGEEVKYISHLDLMKTFERALRRSGIPIAYSQGFNPHPQMVFGLPLSVGVTSEAEYADFDFSSVISPDKLIENLNGSLPKGLLILSAKEKYVKDNIMASISASHYDVLVASEQKQDDAIISKKLEEFMLNSDIIVTKEGKKGPKDINIRPMIFDIRVCELNDIPKSTVQEAEKGLQDSKTWLKDYIKGIYESISKPSYTVENIFCISALLSAGSAANLKPELLISALGSFLEIKLKIVKIHRTGLFVDNKGEMAEPLEDTVLKREMT